MTSAFTYSFPSILHDHHALALHEQLVDQGYLFVVQAVAAYGAHSADAVGLDGAVDAVAGLADVVAVGAGQAQPVGAEGALGIVGRNDAFASWAVIGWVVHLRFVHPGAFGGGVISR